MYICTWQTQAKYEALLVVKKIYRHKFYLFFSTRYWAPHNISGQYLEGANLFPTSQVRTAVMLVLLKTETYKFGAISNGRIIIIPIKSVT